MIFITHILNILQLLLKKRSPEYFGVLGDKPSSRTATPCPLTFDRTHQGVYQGSNQLQSQPPKTFETNDLLVSFVKTSKHYFQDSSKLTKQASKVESRKLFDTLLAYLEAFGRWVFLILMVLNSPNHFVATRRVPLQSKNVTDRVEQGVFKA